MKPCSSALSDSRRGEPACSPTSVAYRRWKGDFAVCENPACCHPGRRFERTNPKHRYCSDLCRREHRYGWRTCPACSVVFIPIRRPDGKSTIYCSLDCANRGSN